MLNVDGPGALAAADAGAEALGPVGETPTPKAKLPAARWPSTFDTVRHETV